MPTDRVMRGALWTAVLLNLAVGALAKLGLFTLAVAY